MENPVTNFVEAKHNLIKHFNCPDDYFIKHVEDSPWTVTEDSGIYFLSYWIGAEKINAVVVKRNDAPLIYQTNDNSMVIAIDCVKIGFILNNKLKK